MCIPQTNTLLESTNSVLLRIINSSFSEVTSGHGGVVSIFARNLVPTVHGSSFLRNNGGALFFQIGDAATVHLDDDYFFENNAVDGGIVYGVSINEISTFNLYTNNVSFVQNKLPINTPCGNVLLSTRIDVSLKNTRFLRNINMLGSSIFFI